VNPSPSAGTIQFSVDNAAAGAPVTVNAGHAAFNLSTLAVGTHTVGASYSGGDNFLGSQGSTGQVVNKAATAVTVGSSAAPSVSGQEVTFTATVAPVAPGGGMPTGTVQFSVAGTPSGDPVPVGAGRASFATTALAVGKNTVAAAYSGDDRFLTSHGSLDQTVNKAATAATLVSSAAAPPTVGEAVTFTATIAAVAPGAGVPTGTVQFSVDGAKAGGPVPVSSGRAALTTTSLTAGKHTVAALYGGAPNFLASQGSLDQTVNADNPVTIAGPPRDPAGLPVAPVTPPAPAPNPAPKGTLPLTGGNPLPLALTAVALTLAGGALRKRTRSAT
jgi:hypothetical protein